MSTPATLTCRMITVVPARKKLGATLYGYIDKATKKPPVAGDMFYHPRYLKDFRAELAPQYFAKHASTRPPICVVLPNGQWWVVDSLAFSAEQGHHGEGWTITGTPPLITATPSISTKGYHGFLENGVLRAV